LLELAVPYRTTGRLATDVPSGESRIIAAIEERRVEAPDTGNQTAAETGRQRQ